MDASSDSRLCTTRLGNVVLDLAADKSEFFWFKRLLALESADEHGYTHKEYWTYRVWWMPVFKGVNFTNAELEWEPETKHCTWAGTWIDRDDLRAWVAREIAFTTPAGQIPSRLRQVRMHPEPMIDKSPTIESIKACPRLTMYGMENTSAPGTPAKWRIKGDRRKLISWFVDKADDFHMRRELEGDRLNGLKAEFDRGNWAYWNTGMSVSSLNGSLGTLLRRGCGDKRSTIDR
jgi:hypothetical protein